MNTYMHFNGVCNWNLCTVPWKVRMWRANLSNCNQRSHSSCTHHVRARTHTHVRANRFISFEYHYYFRVNFTSNRLMWNSFAARECVCALVLNSNSISFLVLFTGYTHVCVTEVFPLNFAGGKYLYFANAIREIEQNNKKRLLLRTRGTRYLRRQPPSRSNECQMKYVYTISTIYCISHTSRRRSYELQQQARRIGFAASVHFGFSSILLPEYRLPRTPDARLPAAHTRGCALPRFQPYDRRLWRRRRAT